MTELSPAAKAVLIAEAKSRCLREDRGCHPDEDDWNGCWFCVHRCGLAAALRAAVDQAEKVCPAQPSNEWGKGWLQGVEDVVAGFRRIASELEVQ